MGGGKELRKKKKKKVERQEHVGAEGVLCRS